MCKDNQIKELRELLKELKELEAITNELDSKYEKDPENEEIEKAFDEAYQKEYCTRDQACKTLSKLIEVDYKTAGRMIATKRNDIENLLSRTA